MNASRQIEIAPSLFDRAEKCLRVTDPEQKTLLTYALREAWLAGEVPIRETTPTQTIHVPGRPLKPELVAPRELHRRSAHTLEGRAALVHALCHIEFNAINLALDAVYRFREMPPEYYRDWLQVAAEEAYHFSLLAAHLVSLGYAYGDFPAHNGLWEMALQTDHDVMVRMALVPRVMEARGLDVTPGIIDKLTAADDVRAVEILQIIHRDEVGHVEIGTRWFRYVCAQRDLSPFATFKQLLKQYLKGQLKGPYDHEVRKRAGFSDEELAYLESVG
ncbi:MAG: DUF455 family protein [Gammaproteobacteria bacterium]|nr:DUF455 family protein [Gammaproteobacteria bacterium]